MLSSNTLSSNTLTKSFLLTNEILTPETFKLVKKRLLEEVGFIGFVEDFDQSVQLLAKHLNWKFNKIKKRNVTTKAELDNSLVQEVASFCYYDIALIEFVKSQFETPPSMNTNQKQVLNLYAESQYAISRLSSLLTK